MLRQAIEKIQPAFIMLGLILVFFGKHIFPTDGNFIGGYDVLDYFFLHAQFIKEQFQSGSVPLWNPYYFCGQPFLANPVNSVFYPSTLLFLALPLPWAFNIDTIVHLYLAALGMYYFVFLLTESKSAGVASAVVYCLSGYFMDRILAGHVTMFHTPALIPWIFFFIEKGFKTKRSGLFLISGLVLGLQILAGYPQGNLYVALFLTMYFFIRYFSIPRPIRHKDFRRFRIYYLLIPVAAFGVGAVQIVPSLEFMSLSDRASNTYEFATFMSFPPQNFFTFLVPKPHTGVLDTNWEFGGYFGILSILLAVIGWVFCKKRRYILCFGILIFTTITIMLGHYTPVYKIYYKFIPLISTFRIPARCIVYIVFSAAVLVGFGVQYLCESRLERKQQSVVMAGVTVIFLCLFCGARFFQIPLASKEMLLAIGLTVSALVILNLIRVLKKLTYNWHINNCCSIS